MGAGNICEEGMLSTESGQWAGLGVFSMVSLQAKPFCQPGSSFSST